MNINKPYILEELHDVYSLMDRLCETTLLLEDTLDQVYAKHYSEGKPEYIPEDVFYKIVPIDPKTDLDKNKKGKFCPWLISLYRAGGLDLNNAEGLANVTEYLKVAYKLNGFDIRQCRSVEDLHTAVEPYLNGKATSKAEEIRRIKERGAEPVYDDNKWIVIVPKTKEAAIYYGKGTRWCTAATESTNLFDSYNSRGPLYININKETGEKYQFHFAKDGGTEFKNASNVEVRNDTVGLTDNLIKFYILRCGLGISKFLNDDVETVIRIAKENNIDLISKAIENGQRDYIKKIAVGDFVIPDGVKSISDDTFKECESLTSIVIPSSVTDMGWYTFSGCVNLTSVTINATLERLEGEVFYGCTNLRSVKLPETLERIGARAFKDCVNLAEINIPDTLLSIGNDGFSGCKSLTSIKFPESFGWLGDRAFFNSGLVSIEIPSKNFFGVYSADTFEGTPWFNNQKDGLIYIGDRLYAYKGVMPNKASIVINDNCHIINSDVFAGRKELRSIKIPDEVFKIDDGAFSGCSGLVSIKLPNYMGTVNEKVLADCVNLKKVELPSYCHTIEDSAFANCASLKSIEIPASVTYFGADIFSGCTNLKVIYLNSEEQYNVFSKNNDVHNVKIRQTESIYHGIMMEALESLLLEAMSLDQIYAAHYSEGKRKEIPEDVFYQIAEADPTKEGDGMGKYTDWMIRLYRSGNLKMEDLYKATEYLEAFHKFKNRIEKKDIGQYQSLPELYRTVKPFIDNPDQATSKSDEVRKIKEGAEKVYEDDEWLVIVPHTKEAAIEYGKGTQWCTAATKSRNYFDHYNNQGLLYININKETGEKYQFHFESKQFMDENDEEIETPIADTIGLTESLKDFYIKKYVAKATSLLSEYEFINYCKRNSIDYIKTFIEEGGLSKYLAREITGHFDIPNTVTKIGDRAFEHCYALTSINIPDSVTEIRDRAFNGYLKLESVTIGNSVETIGRYAFQNCAMLTSVTMGNSVTEIGAWAFASCGRLTNITIPDSVTRINCGAFYCCNSLTSVTIPDSVNYIYDNTFHSCIGLTSITIPDSVTEIGKWAFKGCTSLKSIVIPDSVGYISEYAFDNCKNLTIYVNSVKQHHHIKACGINCKVEIMTDEVNRPVQTESVYHGIMMEALDEILRNYG